MKVDFLVVGQGLAGSAIAFELLAFNQTVMILNDETKPTSSKVAGGIFNPVTGKYLAETWLADTIFPYLKTYYKTLEEKFSSRFFSETNLYRPFANEQQKLQFLKILSERNSDKYVSARQEANEVYEKYVHNPLGGIYTTSAGWVDVPTVLEDFKNYFVDKNVYQATSFDYSLLQINDNQCVSYQGIEAKKIIFAEGFYGEKNPYFSWLPFNSVKGETLIVEFDEYQIPEIINQGNWVLPINENKCRIGATYVWHELDFIPTADGKRYLEERVAKFLKVPYNVVTQEAGVRPATKDRRPFVGQHPAYSTLYIFNGFGTKGVSLIPYFAKELADNLLENKEIHAEATIERFYALYLS